MSKHPGFRVAAGFAFAESHGLTEQAQKIRSMATHLSMRRAAVQKGCLIDLFETHGVIDEFADQHWPRRNTPGGEHFRAKMLDRKALNEQRIADPGAPAPIIDDPDEEPPLFALEAHLRDFIANNLARVPIAQSKLGLFKDPTGRAGIEYPTGVGPIDILATDPAGDFYVFELKLERGPDRALGQLTRYMGWVKVNLAQSRRVTGVIVANSIDEKLRYAVCVVPGVVLLEYELAFAIRGVDPVPVLPPQSA